MGMGDTQTLDTQLPIIPDTMSMKVDQELFQAYAFYAGIVTAKMLVMSFLPARQRFRTGVFISSEDAKQPGTKTGVHEDVERVRRAHLNDMENILPFLILGFLYMFTNPAYATALLCYRLFVGARIVHTIVYLLVIPQPSRALAFFVNVGVNIFMAYKIIVTFMRTNIFTYNLNKYFYFRLKINSI